MADLRFDYSQLQELIDTFKSTREGFEGLGRTSCPTPSSDDPVAKHHAAHLTQQEGKLLTGAATAFENAQDGAQAAYDGFKAADAVGEKKGK